MLIYIIYPQLFCFDEVFFWRGNNHKDEWSNEEMDGLSLCFVSEKGYFELLLFSDKNWLENVWSLIFGTFFDQ